MMKHFVSTLISVYLVNIRTFVNLNQYKVHVFYHTCALVHCDLVEDYQLLYYMVILLLQPA